AGDKIQFDIEVRSTGSTTAKNVVLGDELPTGSGISGYISSQPWGNRCRISYGKLTCDFGNLSPGESRKVTIKSATSKNTDKTYHNTAWAKADGVDKVTDSAWIKVEKIYYYKDDYKKDYDDHRKDYDYGKDDYWSSWYH